MADRFDVILPGLPEGQVREMGRRLLRVLSGFTRDDDAKAVRFARMGLALDVLDADPPRLPRAGRSCTRW